MRQRSENIQWTTSSSIKMTQQQLSMVHKWNDYADTDQRHQCLQHTSTHAYCSARQSWTPHDFCDVPIRVELHLHNAQIATASLRRPLDILLKSNTSMFCKCSLLKTGCKVPCQNTTNSRMLLDWSTRCESSLDHPLEEKSSVRQHTFNISSY